MYGQTDFLGLVLDFSRGCWVGCAPPPPLYPTVDPPLRVQDLNIHVHCFKLYFFSGSYKIYSWGASRLRNVTVVHETRSRILGKKLQPTTGGRCKHSELYEKSKCDFWGIGWLDTNFKQSLDEVFVACAQTFVFVISEIRRKCYPSSRRRDW
jgi:hypothetical protein